MHPAMSKAILNLDQHNTDQAAFHRQPIPRQARVFGSCRHRDSIGARVVECWFPLELYLFATRALFAGGEGGGSDGQGTAPRERGHGGKDNSENKSLQYGKPIV